MTLLEFLGFSLVSSLLKLSWCFYSEKQKEATLQMLEKEIFNLLLDNEYGQFDELAKKTQELYIWLLNR